MQTRPCVASTIRRPHFVAGSNGGAASRPPRGRGVAIRGLAVFALLIVPATIGVGLAFRAGDPTAWVVMVGMPVMAGCAGYWLGRVHAHLELRPDE